MILEPVFVSTNGYAAIFPVASLAVLTSMPLLRRCVATTGRGANGAGVRDVIVMTPPSGRRPPDGMT